MTMCTDSFYYSFFASNRRTFFRFLLWALLLGILGICSPVLAFQSNCPVGSIYYQSNPVLCAGGSVTLGAPTGTGYTYKWYRNTSLIAGATTSTYTTSQEGSFVVAVTANGCTIAFGPLSVSYITAGISPAGPQSLCSGASLVLTGSGSGAPSGGSYTFQYFWMKDGIGLNNGAPMPASYSVTQPGTYYVRVFLNGCYVSSSSVVVSAQSGTPPTISINAPATSFCTNGSLTLSAVGSGTYQWYKDNVALSGATAATYSATAAGVYHCVLNPGGCSATSNSLTLTTGLTAGNTISFSPQSSTIICPGGSVVINGTAGSNFTNQWQKDGINIPGATGNTYTATQAGSYRVIFTNNGCQTIIGSVVVTVVAVPVATITVEGNPAFGQGGDVTLTAPSGANYSYQWKLNAVNIPGATLRVIKPTVSGSYTVEVRNSGCSAVSAAEVVTINDYNYVVTNLITKPGVTTTSQINTLVAGEIQQSISYLDGLGREMQQVVTQGSASKKDVVSFTVLDNLGRESKSYLPYTSGSNGSYKTDVLTAQPIFYQTEKGDDKAFAESRFEASPLSRIIEQGAPGAAWQLAATPEEGKTQKMAYGKNIAGEIRIWNYELSTKEAKGTTFYPADALFYTQSTDEHGLKMREYKDKSGKAICKKVQKTLNDEANYLWTYYVYDDFSNLHFTIPPAAVNKLSTINYQFSYNDTFCQTWLFANQYDTQFRLVEKSVPGGGITFYVYDPLDRVVLSQDPSERASSRWMFTKYDLLGRSIMTGRYKNTDSTQAGMQAIVNTYYANKSIYYENRSANDFTNLHGYSNTAFPQLAIPNTSDSQPLVVNYFDDYDFNYNGILEETTLEEPKFIVRTGFNSTLGQTRGMSTGQRTRVLDKDVWLTSATYYDTDGQMIQAQVENYNATGIADMSKGITLELENTLYDFDGKVAKTERRHCQSYSDVAYAKLTINKRFVYDHTGQVTESYMQLDADAEQRIGLYEYNALGEMVAKRVGTGTLQKIDYAYNIRGWLKTVNGGNLSNDGDIFAMSYAHQEGGSTPQYNGNIAKYDWISKTDAIRRTYQITYDGLNRLKSATYSAVNASNISVPEAFSVNNLTYDDNGNILTMNRQNLVKRNSNGADQFDYVDKLRYNYYDDTSNKLKWVEDDADPSFKLAESSDFPDLSSIGTNPIEYTYDSEGRLTKDLNKGITSVVYNDRDLPATISLGTSNYIAHTYDAARTKLQMEVTMNGGAAITSKYFNGIVYLDNVLQFIETPEGRALPPKTQAGPWTYEYNYLDHLGNLRVAFRASNTIDILPATMDDSPVRPEWSNTSGTIRNSERSATGANSAKLTTANPIGPWKTIKVNKGDLIVVRAQGKYVESPTNNAAVTLTTYVTNLPAQSSESRNSPRLLGLGLQITPAEAYPLSNTVPKAYLEYILQTTDERGVARMRKYLTPKASTTYGTEWESLEMSYLVEEDGNLQVLVVNESDKPVWFDNVDIDVTPGLVYQETHYDPWGLELAGIEDHGNPEDKYKFQGKELIDELALNWQDFGARYYDPQLGRWHVTDPADQFGSPYAGMGNNPVNGTDPDGCWFGIDDLAAAGIGFAIGYVSSGISSGDWGKKSLLAGGIGAVTGWLAYNTGGLSAATSVSGTSHLGSFATNQALSIASGYLPSSSMQVGNFSFSMGLSLNTSGIGMNMGAGYSDRNVSLGVSYGVGNNTGTNDLSGDLFNQSQGMYNFFSASAGAKINGTYFGLTLGRNNSTGPTGQSIGYGGVQIGDFGLRLDEDFLGDGHDRWKTGGGTATYRLNNDVTLAVGLGMITGQHGKGQKPKAGDNSTYYASEETPHAYRGGAFYGGIIYKGVASFGGINSEKGLHGVQNWIHRLPFSAIKGTPYFEDLGYRSKPWSYFGTYNTNSLIY